MSLPKLPTIALEVVQSEARTFTFRFIDKRTREPIDLTARVVTFSVRDELGSGTTLIQETTTHQAQAPLATRGKTDLNLSTSDTNVDRGEHVWDLWLDDERAVRNSVFIVTGSARYGEP
jgi:hypothetical protein